MGERLAAGPGDQDLRHPVGEGGAGGPTPRWSARSRPTVFVPPPRVDSALVRDRPPPGRPATRPTGRRCSRLVRGRLRPAPQDAPPLAGRPRRRPRPSRPAGVRPEARAEELALADWRRLAAAVGRRLTRVRSAAVADVVLAPAKLTLSLRVTGVRADGYHLIDAEMVTLDLADELTLRRRRRPRAASAPAPDVPADDDNLVRRALAAVGRSAQVRLDKRIPSGRRPRRRVEPTPPPCCAGPAAHDLDLAATLGRRRAVLRRAAAGPGCGASARWSSPLPHRARTFTLLTPPVHCSTAAVYRAWDDLGGPTAAGPTTSSPPRWRWSRSWPAGATAWATPPGRSRCSPAAARPGSWRAPTPARATCVVRTVARSTAPDRPPPREAVGRTRSVVLAGGRLLAGGPALPARALQHLLVLLLAHALAALLDQ